jgi:hypothetical protein
MKIAHILVWNALTKNQKPYIGVEILLKSQLISDRYPVKMIVGIPNDNKSKAKVA